MRALGVIVTGEELAAHFAAPSDFGCDLGKGGMTKAFVCDNANIVERYPFA